MKYYSYNLFPLTKDEFELQVKKLREYIRNEDMIYIRKADGFYLMSQL